MNKWISVDDIIAEQKKYCLLCEGEEEATHCSVCFAKDVVSAIIYHTQGIDLVRCAECKFWSENTQFCHMFSTKFTAMRMLPNDFCSLGVKKENE